MLFFLKSLSLIACPIKYSQNFLVQLLLKYTSCLFSIFLNDDIVDIEQPDGMCSPTFVVNKFSGLLLHHQSVLLKIQDLHK